MWSGTLYSLATYADEVIRNFVRLNSATSYDEYASVITTFNYNRTSPVPTVANLLQYTKEVADAPSTFESFLAVPTIFNEAKIASMGNTAQATATMHPGGAR